MKANFKISLLILGMVAMVFRASAQAPSIAYTGSTALASGTAFTITPTNTGGAVPATVYGKVTSIAGNPYGATGYVNGTGDNAQFNLPSGIVGDASGNIYMADYSNNAIRKITSAGVTTTFAGSSTGVAGFTNGTGTGALFNSPNGIAIDGSGNLYVSDAGNNAIRKITAVGVVTTLYQNTSTAFNPAGLCIDPSGNVIVTAQSACQIWKITPAGVMTVVAGAGYTGFDDGNALDATFNLPGDVKRDASGNLYIADYYNNAIRKISPAGVVTTLSGGILMGYANGSGTTALFSAPTSVAVGSGNVIYVTDFNNNDIRRVMPDGTTSLVAGSPTQVAGMADSIGTVAGFNEPTYIYIDANGNGYTLEFIGRVRKIALTGYTLKGTLPAGLTFNSATGTISGTPTGTITATTDTITAFNASGYSTAMVNFTAGSGLPTIVYGSQSYTYTPGTPITTLTPTVTGNPVPYTGYTTTYAGNGIGASIDGIGTAASFYTPDGLAEDQHGNMYLVDQGTYEIRKITPSGIVSTVAGNNTVGFVNGTGTAANFNHPVGLTVDTSGNIYVADQSNNAIRKITPAGVVTTLAGGTQGSADGTGATAQFYNPTGVAVDVSGNVYVSDYLNNLIRKITPGGVVTTFAGSIQGSSDGTGTAAQFNRPADLAIDASGNLFIADRGNEKLRKITPAGVVTTIAGNGTTGYVDGAAANAEFNMETNLAVDQLGNVYVADYLNNRVRRFDPAGTVSTLAGNGTVGATNGLGNIATFNTPDGLRFDPWGNFYVADRENNLIRQVVTTPYTISPTLPVGLSFDPSTGIIRGTPTAETDSTITYTITAYNTTGIGTTTLRLNVQSGAPFRPSSDQNYVMTQVARVGGLLDNTTFSGAQSNPNSVQSTVQYLDGLDRPIQTVQVKGSPNGNDLVQPIAYDLYGRETIKYLPYALTGPAVSGGGYESSAINDQNSFYTSPPTGVTTITYPYSASGLEASPLNRLLEQGAPGTPWQLTTSGVDGSGHTIKVAYTTNLATDVILWTVNSSGNGATGTANYAAGQLFATTTTDENGNNTVEYKDKEGHIVCKKVMSGLNTYLATYYVYNSLDNLCYVIPPIPATTAYPTSFVETDAVFTNFIYGYHYDERNRLVQTHIPGKGWMYTVYNQLDQPVLVQDAVQRSSNQWTVTKYDQFGRVIVTGLWNAGSAIAQNTLQASIYAGAQWDAHSNDATTGYTLTSYPALSKILTINYYDNYNNLPGQPASFAVTGFSTMTNGLLTATKTAVLNTITNTTPDMLWTTHYYDDLGRETQSFRQHYLGGTLSAYNYDAMATTYDFTNEITAITRQHYAKNSGNTAAVLNATISNTYVYDQVGRKTQTFEKINSGSNILLSQNNYNEVGQLMTKHLHGATGAAPFLQDISYAYNERGWLSKINDPVAAPAATKLFAEQLNYNLPQYGATAQFNGNIAEQDYNAGVSGRQHVLYAYDALNRLNNGTSSAGFSETGITYDNMGNILTLTRAGTGNGTLNYSYTGNQLTSLSGFKTGTDTYDANGNLKTDGIRAATITYNLLNLPQTVSATGVNITYTYDAAGDKLRKVSGGSSTDYISGIQYKPNAATIDFIQTEEGRAINSGTTYNYEYTLTDQLGNNRVTFDQVNGKVGEDDYFPFGLNIHRQVNAGNNYLYNKKELQNEITEYDYGARFYDPVIGRWGVIDPLAEKSRRFSPYTYVENNPIRLIDPDGMEVEDGDCCGVGAFVRAFVNDIRSGTDNLKNTIRHPINAANGILTELKRDKKTGTAKFKGDIAIATSSTYNTFSNGDLDTKMAVLGTLTGEGLQLFGGEVAEADKVGELSKLAETSTIVENAAKGKAFEPIVTQGLENAGHTNIAEQVTIKPNGVDGNVRLDNISTKDGKIALTDAKSSATAGFTKNQKIGYPALESNGGTVVGNKGAAQGYPAGTKIPPTKVDVVRP